MNVTPSLVEGSEIEPRSVSFLSGEYMLQGHLFSPHGQPTAIVVISGATGVPARYYSAFASWLAEEKGIAVLTYDYRDFGASARGRPRDSVVTMSDWGVHDGQAARDFAAELFPTTPLWVIGHSLGALCLPFQTGLDRIERVIAICSGPVHVGDHPWHYQPMARFFWYGPVPLLVRLTGYLPGRALGLGPDLPPQVYWQWRRWCTSRSFYTEDIGTHLPHPNWASLTAKMKFVAASDDHLIPPEVVWRLMQQYTHAKKTREVLHPDDFDLKSIGHISAFSAKNRATWESVIA